MSVEQRYSGRLLTPPNLGTWKGALSQAEEIVRAFEEHDQRGDMFFQAKHYLSLAHASLRELKAGDPGENIARYLRVIHTLWERSWLHFYEEELRHKASLSLTKVDKGSAENRERVREIFDDELKNLSQALIAFAICASIIQRFPARFTPAIQRHLVRSIPRKEGKGSILAVLELGDGFYIPTISGQPLSVFGFIPEISREGGEYSLHVFLPDPLLREQREIISFSAKDIAPHAFTSRRESGRFLMPRILQELQGEEEVNDIYLGSILAAALGKESLVDAYGEFLLQKKIKDYLLNHGIRGDFMPRYEQTKLAQERRYHSFPAETREHLKDKKILHNGFCPPCLLCALERTSLSSLIPDLNGSLARNLMYQATIIKTDYAESCIEMGTTEPERHVVRTTREFELELFLAIGPWLFHLEAPNITHREEKDMLVDALQYSLVERTVSAIEQREERRE